MSYCSKCGNMIPDNTPYCPCCGTSCYQSNYPSYGNYNNEFHYFGRGGADPELEKSMMKKVFGCGVGALICGLIGIIMGVPGVFLGIFSLKFSQEFQNTFGSIYGMARVGKIFGIIGIILSGLGLLFFLLGVFACSGGCDYCYDACIRSNLSNSYYY